MVAKRPWLWPPNPSSSVFTINAPVGVVCPKRGTATLVLPACNSDVSQRDHDQGQLRSVRNPAPRSSRLAWSQNAQGAEQHHAAAAATRTRDQRPGTPVCRSTNMVSQSGGEQDGQPKAMNLKSRIGAAVEFRFWDAHLYRFNRSISQEFLTKKPFRGGKRQIEGGQQ